jgi:hypothetical protein
MSMRGRREIIGKHGKGNFVFAFKGLKSERVIRELTNNHRVVPFETSADGPRLIALGLVAGYGLKVHG